MISERRGEEKSGVFFFVVVVASGDIGELADAQRDCREHVQQVLRKQGHFSVHVHKHKSNIPRRTTLYTVCTHYLA